MAFKSFLKPRSASVPSNPFDEDAPVSKTSTVPTTIPGPVPAAVLSPILPHLTENESHNSTPALHGQLSLPVGGINALYSPPSGPLSADPTTAPAPPPISPYSGPQTASAVTEEPGPQRQRFPFGLKSKFGLVSAGARPPPTNSGPSSSATPTGGSAVLGGEDGEERVIIDSLTFFTSETPSDVRQRFVRKVYILWATSAVVSLFFALFFTLWHTANVWIYENQWIFWLCISVSLCLVAGLALLPLAAHLFPLSIVFLLMLGTAEGIALGYINAISHSAVVTIAAGMILVMMILLAIVACQTKVDFTSFYMYPLVFLIAMALFGLSVGIFRQEEWLHLLYGCVAVVVVVFYLVFHTQRMVGGRIRSYRYTVKDWSYGALAVYIDSAVFVWLCLKIVTCHWWCCRRCQMKRHLPEKSEPEREPAWEAPNHVHDV